MAKLQANKYIITSKNSSTFLTSDNHRSNSYHKIFYMCHAYNFSWKFHYLEQNHGILFSSHKINLHWIIFYITIINMIDIFSLNNIYLFNNSLCKKIIFHHKDDNSFYSIQWSNCIQRDNIFVIWKDCHDCWIPFTPRVKKCWCKSDFWAIIGSIINPIIYNLQVNIWNNHLLKYWLLYNNNIVWYHGLRSIFQCQIFILFWRFHVEK